MNENPQETDGDLELTDDDAAAVTGGLRASGGSANGLTDAAADEDEVQT